MHIQESTFDFLKQLKANNTREWFQANKDAYDGALLNVKSFIEELIKELAAIDPQINTDIQASKCMFRIYRDVRFSKDKSPYKAWLAAGISIDGRKLDGPEYYIHIEPNNTFIAAGYWRPKKEHLEAIRQEMDYNYAHFERALSDGGWKLEDLSQEDKLSRPPAGYTIDTPNLEALKLKSFIIHRPVTDLQMTGKDAMKTIVDLCKRILPFKNFIHDAIDG